MTDAANHQTETTPANRGQAQYVDDPHPWAGYTAVGAGLLAQVEPMGILGLIGVVAAIIAITAKQGAWGWIGLLLSGLALVTHAPFWFVLAIIFGVIALSA